MDENLFILKKLECPFNIARNWTRYEFAMNFCLTEAIEWTKLIIRKYPCTCTILRFGNFTIVYVCVNWIKRKCFQLSHRLPSGLIFLSLFSLTFILTLMGSGPFYRYLPLFKLFEIASQEIRKLYLYN